MSRHLAILRRARLDAELFAPPPRLEEPRVSWNASAGRDQWQQLVHHLFLRRGLGAHQSIGLASATAGEGASYVAFHLATELARSGRPTLLLEANVHRPAQAKRHGIEPDPGLRHILMEENFPLDSCLHQTAVEQLWVLPAGSSVNGSSGPPDWTRFHNVFDALRERFAGIIGDLPAVNLSADATIIAPQFDGLVLVVEADLCSREVIQNAAARLRRANPNVLGTILNKRKFYIPAPLYRRL